MIRGRPWIAASGDMRGRAMVALFVARTAVACGGRTAVDPLSIGGASASSPAGENGVFTSGGASGASSGARGSSGVVGASSGVVGASSSVVGASSTTGAGEGMCIGGEYCQPNDDPCAEGRYVCTSETQAACIVVGNVPDGASCGTGRICCGGECASCDPSIASTAICSGTACVGACPGGTTSCGSTCVDATSRAACGPSCGACPSGWRCVDSVCTATFGAVTPGACSQAPDEHFHPGFIGGELVVIAMPIEVTALGMVGSPSMPAGVDVIMALYTDDAGTPFELVTRTPSTPVVSGNDTVATDSVAHVAEGRYWIMAEFDAEADVCVDTSTANDVIFEGIASYGTVPATLPTTGVTPVAYPDTNYYVVGTE